MTEWNRDAKVLVHVTMKDEHVQQRVRPTIIKATLCGFSTLKLNINSVVTGQMASLQLK